MCCMQHIQCGMAGRPATVLSATGTRRQKSRQLAWYQPCAIQPGISCCSLKHNLYCTQSSSHALAVAVSPADIDLLLSADRHKLTTATALVNIVSQQIGTVPVAALSTTCAPRVPPTGVHRSACLTVTGATCGHKMQLLLALPVSAQLHTYLRHRSYPTAAEMTWECQDGLTPLPHAELLAQVCNIYVVCCPDGSACAWSHHAVCADVAHAQAHCRRLHWHPLHLADVAKDARPGLESPGSIPLQSAP